LPKLLINYRINIYLLSLSKALAAKIFTMKSLFMLAVSAFHRPALLGRLSL